MSLHNQTIQLLSIQDAEPVGGRMTVQASCHRHVSGLVIVIPKNEQWTDTNSRIAEVDWNDGEKTGSGLFSIIEQRKSVAGWRLVLEAARVSE